MYIPKSQFKKVPPTDHEIITKAGDYVADATVILTSYGKYFSIPKGGDLELGDFSKVEEYITLPTKFLDTGIDFGSIFDKKEKTYYPTPTEQDYAKGVFPRYVIQDKRDKSIKEVDKPTYEKIKKKRYFRRLAIGWVLKGPIEDQQIGEYMYPGAKAQNLDILDQAEEHIPGIKDYFKDPAQFVK